MSIDTQATLSSWSAMNKAQTQEKIILMEFLSDLLNFVHLPDEKRAGPGRPSMPLRERIYCLTLHQYCGKSSRRTISELEFARMKGYISKVPHFNTLLDYYNDKGLVEIMKHIVSMSGNPLKEIEFDFAVDATGFSTLNFERWFDIRTEKKSKKRMWKKVHATTGVKTNVITAVNITPGYAADSPQFEELIKTTSRMYDIREVSADMAYSSRKNLELVDSLGGTPYIPFKSNTTGKSGGSKMWRRTWEYFQDHHQEFMKQYHKRSNVESTFSMLKRKFGHVLRTKLEYSQANEILAKCLCHNLCVLIRAMFELGIDIDFYFCANRLFARKNAELPCKAMEKEVLNTRG